VVYPNGPVSASAYRPIPPLTADPYARLRLQRHDRIGRWRGDDHLDPKRVLVLEIRALARLAQRVQAVLLFRAFCVGKARQLEDHPGAQVHLTEVQRELRSLGLYLDLGGRAERALVARDAEVLAVTAED